MRANGVVVADMSSEPPAEYPFRHERRAATELGFNESKRDSESALSPGPLTLALRCRPGRPTRALKRTPLCSAPQSLRAPGDRRMRTRGACSIAVIGRYPQRMSVLPALPVRLLPVLPAVHGDRFPEPDPMSIGGMHTELAEAPRLRLRR